MDTLDGQTLTASRCLSRAADVAFAPRAMAPDLQKQKPPIRLSVQYTSNPCRLPRVLRGAGGGDSPNNCRGGWGCACVCSCVRVEQPGDGTGIAQAHALVERSGNGNADKTTDGGSEVESPSRGSEFYGQT